KSPSPRPVRRERPRRDERARAHRAESPRSGPPRPRRSTPHRCRRPFGRRRAARECTPGPSRRVRSRTRRHVRRRAAPVAPAAQAARCCRRPARSARPWSRAKSIVAHPIDVSIRLALPRLKPGRAHRRRPTAADALSSHHPSPAIEGHCMPALLRDVRYGFRSLLKNPGLTIVSVFALTLGIGLTTTMFSIVYGALLKGLPYPDGDRIMVVNRANPARGITRQALPIQDYVDYKAQ